MSRLSKNIFLGVMGTIMLATTGALVYKLYKVAQLTPKKASIENIWKEEADTNHDGTLTLEEKSKAWKNMGWRLEQQLNEEYSLIQPGKPERILPTLRWEIEQYETNLQKKGFEFYYNKEAKEYIVTKKPQSLRK